MNENSSLGTRDVLKPQIKGINTKIDIKIKNNFLRVAAREWLSFTRRTDAVHPSQQKYGLFAARRSREGKLYP